MKNRINVVTYRVPPARRLPLYVGPLSYHRRLGWWQSWRGATGIELGVAGHHLCIFYVPRPATTN